MQFRLRRRLPVYHQLDDHVDDNGDSYFAEMPGGVNVGNAFASFLRDSATLGGVHNGNQILVPFDWGTEGSR